ncbi:hypothetical protein T10_8811 [Trichinella papuae]|uniref:Secreted protein n=1 Tax=Trichinella papuae TaxID=268474 RepID=A0A0V1MRQ8_9BILA|nr:hypothetical protein T10_8811 [Trichinella papuae]
MRRLIHWPILCGLLLWTWFLGTVKCKSKNQSVKRLLSHTIRTLQRAGNLPASYGECSFRSPNAVFPATGDLPGVRHDPWQSDDKPTENCSRGTMFSFPLHLRSTTIFGSQPLLSPFHSRLCKDSESTARADVEEPALQVEGQARSRHCLTEKPSDFSTTAETPSLH